ncbi:MAG: TatD family hydrolase [Pseudomonadota bacterium]
MTAELIDICFNFTHSAFRDDEQEVLDRAIEAGVIRLMVTGSSASESRYCIELAERYPQTLYATAGVHPHLSKDWGAQTLEQLREMAGHERVKAIGEAGLDYNRNYSPPDAQRFAFERQIELACELEMPLFLHERDAHEDFVSILDPYRKELSNVVVHCFTGTGEQLDAYLNMDLHIGITGWICDERRGQHLQELVKRIPLNRLMLETDAPYLVPRDINPPPKGRRNEPAYLPHVLNTVARCVGLDAASVAASTTSTARRFYHLD